jgi:branched-chain amino acid transport system ATP-binding protein
MTIGEGEVVTLAGRNGAGKTTLIKAVIGLVPTTSGSITFDGEPIDGLSIPVRAQRGLGLVPDDRGIYASLSVAEHLALVRPGGERAWAMTEIYETFPRLKERRNSAGTKLSGGEAQMLAIARVLRMGSSVLLCDEPTEGLAPTIVSEIGQLFRRVKQQGASILLVEQNLEFATSVADRHYLISSGRIEREMSNSETKSREQELLDYLGV